MPKEQRERHWTLSKNDKLVRGAVMDVFDRATAIEQAFGTDRVITVTEVSWNDFGSKKMRHWFVVGR
ncbi:MAG: hypothetical protein FWE08_03825 [Oscillospiraceae bacterium]|nr:hypothetical protein [Oscillospiraceae bacterium]